MINVHQVHCDLLLLLWVKFKSVTKVPFGLSQEIYSWLFEPYFWHFFKLPRAMTKPSNVCVFLQ